jgi:tetratricopeptide (TPR) repeat protein
MPLFRFFTTTFIVFACFFSALSPLAAQTTASDWFFKGKEYRDAGDFDNALLCFDRAIVLSPEFAGAYNNRGTVKAGLNQHAEAVKDLQKSADLGVPLTSVNYYNLGYSLEQLGRCSEAIDAYMKCKEQIGVKIESFNIDINEAIKRVMELCKV